MSNVQQGMSHFQVLSVHLIHPINLGKRCIWLILWYDQAFRLLGHWAFLVGNWTFLDLRHARHYRRQNR